MSRSLLITIAVIALMGGAAAVRMSRRVPSAEAPVHTGRVKYECEGCNVLLISIDTLRADHLSSYGYERETSPNIDRFAHGGLLFENAISQSTWTTPAHASMMTGLLPEEHGLIMYPAPGRLSAEFPTIATLLKARGYQTVSFNGGGFVNPNFGLGRGFDVYQSKSRNFKRNIAAAKKWLVKHGEQKFFMFLHGFDVHRPYTHSEHNTFYKPEKNYDIEAFCHFEKRRREGDELEYIIAQYDAGIVYVDRLFKRFFGFLKKRGLLKNTVIIITSDHGDEFFEHGKCGHILSVYRELAHVPLIIRIPEGAKGRIERPVAASVSLLPTIASILRLDASVDRTGDLMTIVKEQTAAHDFIVTETGSLTKKDAAGNRSVEWHMKGTTTPEWKLVYSQTHGEVTHELYDVRADLREATDVASAHPEVIRRMWHRMFPNGTPKLTTAKEAGNIDTETLEQLKALGYVDAD